MLASLAELHAAVRKLRQLVEDGGARPTRVITTESGYKLGDHAKRRRA